jgi:hypothetical protein
MSPERVEEFSPSQTANPLGAPAPAPVLAPILADVTKLS